MDSRNKPENAYVSLTVEIPSLKKVATILRTIKNAKNPKLTPNDPDVRAVLAKVALHPEFALSRRELIRYVLAEPGKRAKEVQELLRLDEVEALRALFQKIANASDRDVKLLNSARNEARTALQRALNLTHLSAATIVTAANEKRTVLSLPALSMLEANTSIKDGIVSAAATVQPSKVAKVHAKADVEALRTKLAGMQSPEFVSACAKVAAAVGNLSKDERFLQSASRETLLQSALSFFDDKVCPVCDTPWKSEDFRRHLANKLEHYSAATQQRKEVEQKLVPIITELDAVRTAATSIARYGVLLQPAVDCGAISGYVAELAHLSKALKDFLPLGATSNALAATSNVPEHVRASRFSPEIARRLGHPAFTRRLVVSYHALEKFVAEPMELLQEIIRTLDANSCSAIALVFMRGGSLPSPLTITPDEERAVELLGGANSEVRNALVALEGSLLIQVRQRAAFFWRYKHPTIRDAFAAHVSQNRELLDIYLAGTPVAQLFAEISCGDVGLAGVKVVVPEDRYDALLGRIASFILDQRENKDQVYRFFARRCDSSFLARFLAGHPGFLASLQVRSYLDYISDVGVVVRLHEFGLLPEPDRGRHVAKIRELAVGTPDAGFLREDIRTLFEGSELNEIVADVRAKLLPHVLSRINEWADNHNGEDDPEHHFILLRSALTDFRDALSEDDEAHRWLEAGLAEIKRATDELRSNLPEEPERDEFFETKGAAGDSDGSRSVFDDVDQ